MATANKDETKTCELCKEEFSRRRASGALVSPSTWINRKYCSQKCMRNKNKLRPMGGGSW